MSIHPLAGKHPTPDMLVNIPRLISAYYTEIPDPSEISQQVSFGTSGHRGSSLKKSFTETHILAIVQAVCEFRKKEGTTGPLFLGMDTHALSESAFITALEVLAGNGIETFVQFDRGYTPTPVLSHAILSWNKDKKENLADGLIITPSHNPPTDGGIKYNPSNGGPADTDITGWIQNRANEILKQNGQVVKRISFETAWKMEIIHKIDYITHYVEDLKNVVNMDAIRNSNLKLAADALGGSGLAFWSRIADYYHFSLDTYHTEADPTFRFMTVDKDGKIRMDCSSSYAIAGLLQLKDKYDVAFGNDPDFDRHGIVTRDGLMSPNAYLAVAIQYLFTHRLGWSKIAKIGKTLVSSSMIDRVAQSLNRELAEVPVGFKWFVPGLINGSYAFGGEESAGASFLRMDGSTWTTDKDGIIMGLLAAEIMAVTQKSPSEHYRNLTQQFGTPVYTRIDAVATREQKAILKKLSPEKVAATMLAGDLITQKLTHAPANNAPIEGLKVTTQNGWFAARPSGTEDIYKIYAESFKGDAHLQQIVDEAQKIVSQSLSQA